MTALTARTAAGSAGLAAIVGDPARALIATDFDGTLAPIVPRPDDAVAAPGAVDALVRLSRVCGAVAVITGRPAADAVARAGFADVAGLEQLVVLGHYGLERWDARTGRVTAPPPHPGVAQARARLAEVVAGVPGARLEDKGHSVAAHVRGAADPDAALAALAGPVHALAAAAGLEVAPGRLVLEVRPGGVDKGAALRRYAEERQAAGVLFAGDDLGDLPAFDAVEAMRRAGVPGVTVCSGSDEVSVVAERADIVVGGPAGVVALFTALAAAIGTA